MTVSLTQIFLSIFIIFALIKILVRFREGNLSPLSFLFWQSLFLLGLIIILFPGLTSALARSLGIGRGADAVIYFSIILIFFLLFRLYLYLEDVRNDLTEIVKELALKNSSKKRGRRTTQN